MYKMQINEKTIDHMQRVIIQLESDVKKATQIAELQEEATRRQMDYQFNEQITQMKDCYQIQIDMLKFDMLDLLDSKPELDSKLKKKLQSLASKVEQ